MFITPTNIRRLLSLHIFTHVFVNEFNMEDDEQNKKKKSFAMIVYYTNEKSRAKTVTKLFNNVINTHYVAYFC